MTPSRPFSGLAPARFRAGLAALLLLCSAGAAAAAPPATPSAAALADPVVTRGPYLQIGTPTTIRIRWRTDLATDTRVRYGTAPDALTQSALDPALATEHEMLLLGLVPETRYYYAIGATTPVVVGPDSVRSFVTSPPIGTARPARIWVIGDSGLPGLAAQSVRDAYTAYTGSRPTDLWLMLGDNAYGTGTDAQYQAAVFDMYPDMLATSVLWPTRGNHDLLYAGSFNDYLELFSMPTAGQAGGVASGSEAYYSFDHGDIHFICLDSEGTSRNPAGPMMTWLQADIAASTALWNIAFWHHPPYTKGSHDSDDPSDSGGRMRDMRTNALPILEAGGVDLVLTGHSHSYERSYLLDGHYGLSGTLTPAMVLDAGDGRLGGDGAYQKATPGRAPHEGAVYTVAGSSAQTSGGTLNHPVMVRSLNVLGSLVLDIEGNRLHCRFLTGTGAVMDSFTILKAPGALDVDRTPAPTPGPSLSLAGPNPSGGETRLRFVLPQGGEARIELVDAAGRRVATLLEGRQAPGAGQVAWSGRDARGRRVPDGMYFAVLQTGGERRVVRITRAR